MQTAWRGNTGVWRYLWIQGRVNLSVWKWGLKQQDYHLEQKSEKQPNHHSEPRPIVFRSQLPTRRQFRLSTVNQQRIFNFSRQGDKRKILAYTGLASKVPSVQRLLKWRLGKESPLIGRHLRTDPPIISLHTHLEVLQDYSRQSRELLQDSRCYHSPASQDRIPESKQTHSVERDLKYWERSNRSVRVDQAVCGQSHGRRPSIQTTRVQTIKLRGTQTSTHWNIILSEKRSQTTFLSNQGTKHPSIGTVLKTVIYSANRPGILSVFAWSRRVNLEGFFQQNHNEKLGRRLKPDTKLAEWVLQQHSQLVKKQPKTSLITIDIEEPLSIGPYVIDRLRTTERGTPIVTGEIFGTVITERWAPVWHWVAWQDNKQLDGNKDSLVEEITVIEITVVTGRVWCWKILAWHGRVVITVGYFIDLEPKQNKRLVVLASERGEITGG